MVASFLMAEKTATTKPPAVVVPWAVAPSWGDHPDNTSVALEVAYFGVRELADCSAFFVHRQSDGVTSVEDGTAGDTLVICVLGRGNRVLHAEEWDAVSSLVGDDPVSLLGGLEFPKDGYDDGAGLVEDDDVSGDLVGGDSDAVDANEVAVPLDTFPERPVGG